MDGRKSALKTVKCLHFYLDPVLLVLHATAQGMSKALLLHKTATLREKKKVWCGVRDPELLLSWPSRLDQPIGQMGKTEGRPSAQSHQAGEPGFKGRAL